MYKINIEDRSYKKYDIFYNVSLMKVNNSTTIIDDPFEKKLFNNDVFQINEEKIEMYHSIIRSMKFIPGILILKNNKTYGKIKNRYFYQCIPDDKRLPLFLLPYEIKNVSFSKCFSNKYVVFKFNNWDEKFPIGKIEQIIGDVSESNNYYEYELYCKSLYASITNFKRETLDKIKEKTCEKCIENIKQRYKLYDCTEEYTFTIDSKQTTDYDDAFSIIALTNEKCILKIHIANVVLWLDELKLWDSFSNRIASIYLPDRKRPMIPTILSEHICSLNESSEKIAFTMELLINNNEIQNISYYNSFIKVNKNFVYEEEELLNNKNYILLKELFIKLTRNPSDEYKYITSLKNSFDVVTYGMVLMNYFTAIKIAEFNKGIFKSCSIANKVFIPGDLNDEIKNFIKIWNGSVTQYCLYDNKNKHELLKLDSYIHITSPIRRLVDIINMSILQEELELIEKNEARVIFIDKWSNSMEYINTTMRAIKKVQRNCNLLHMCIHDSTILETEYSCLIFDKLVRNDDLIQYMIYNKELKSVSRITTSENLFTYRYYKFKIYMFEDEANLKKKIRYQLVDNIIVDE